MGWGASLRSRQMASLLQVFELDFFQAVDTNRALDAFDVIAEMTWSSSLGFLEAGEDVNAMIRTMERDMDYFAPVR